MSRTVTAINLLLGVAIAALLAAITAGVISSRISMPLLPKGGKGAVPAAAPAKVEDLAAYAPILTNGLFGKGDTGQLTPIVNAPAG